MSKVVINVKLYKVPERSTNSLWTCSFQAKKYVQLYHATPERKCPINSRKWIVQKIKIKIVNLEVVQMNLSCQAFDFNWQEDENDFQILKLRPLNELRDFICQIKRCGNIRFDFSNTGCVLTFTVSNHCCSLSVSGFSILFFHFYCLTKM